jgi:hypothetical protein
LTHFADDAVAVK